MEQYTLTPGPLALKTAMNAGNAEELFPVGTKIFSTVSGIVNNLVVGDYQIVDTPAGKRRGMILIREFCEPIQLQQSASSNMVVHSQDVNPVDKYLAEVYPLACGQGLAEVITEIRVPYYNSTSSGSAHFYRAKFFIPSSTEVMASSYPFNGLGWQIWKERCNVTAPTSAAKTGRIARTVKGDTGIWWLRDAGNYGCEIGASGQLATNIAGTERHHLLIACCITADELVSEP